MDDVKDEEDAEIDFGSSDLNEDDGAGEFSLDNLGMIATFMGMD